MLSDNENQVSNPLAFAAQSAGSLGKAIAEERRSKGL